MHGWRRCTPTNHVDAPLNSTGEIDSLKQTEKKKPNLLVRRTFCSLYPDDCGPSQILDGRRELQGLDLRKAMDRSKRKTPPAWKQNSESIYSILSPHPCHTTYLPLNRRTAALMGARVHYDQPRRSCEREKNDRRILVLIFWLHLFSFSFFLFFPYYYFLFFLFLMSDIPLRHHTTPLSMCSAARRRMVTKGSIGSGPGVLFFLLYLRRLYNKSCESWRGGE